MAIKCVWHDHPLQLRSVLSDSKALCFICLQPLSGYNYKCPDCNIFIHISCLKLPLESLHPLHQHHPLSLLTHPPHNNSPHNSPQILCNSCNTLCSGFTYHCSLCCFSLHLQCALKQNTFKLEIHNHSLTFFPYPFGGFESFRCSVCTDPGYGFCLACKACEFVIHLECSKFPATVKTTRHWHPLSITSVRSVDDGSGEFYCDIVCEGEVNPKGCVYYCGECNYMAHLQCLSFAPKPHIKLSYKDVDVSSSGSLDESNPKHETAQNRVFVEPQMGSNDEGLTKIRHRFSELRIMDKAESTQAGSGSQLAEIIQLEHFSHEHPLTLNIEHSKNKISCSSCCEKISSLAYGCAQCNYFLHRWCGELPQKIRHPLHPQHDLPLLSRGRSKVFLCNACDEPCDTFTFAYNCEPCEFNLHPMCASIPSTLRNEIHHHPLFLSRKKPYSVTCNTCCEVCHTGTVFECEECNLVLDFKCATLPHTIRHKCHVDPLSLTYVPFEDDDSDEFYCDACETLRDPTHWVYYCAGCEFSAHMNCVVSDLLGGFPSSGLLEYDHHEHLLGLITKSHSNPS